VSLGWWGVYALFPMHRIEEMSLGIRLSIALDTNFGYQLTTYILHVHSPLRSECIETRLDFSASLPVVKVHKEITQNPATKSLNECEQQTLILDNVLLGATSGSLNFIPALHSHF